MFKKSVLFFLSLSAILVSSCATVKPGSSRGPANADAPSRISRDGESCQVDLDGNNVSEKVEIGNLFGKRVLFIMHPEAGTAPARFFVEELRSNQAVDCIVNMEPGVPFRGTDETQKAVSVPLQTDYLKVESDLNREVRFLYYDAKLAAYKTLWRAD